MSEDKEELTPLVGSTVRKRLKSRRKIDAATGFVLYCLGLNAAQIARHLKVNPQTLQALVSREKWEDRRANFEVEQALYVTTKLSKTQQAIRAGEVEAGKELLKLGRVMLAKYSSAVSTLSPKAIKPDDICKVLDLSSRMFRMGASMPTAAVEVVAQVDLTDSLLSAVDRVYGPKVDPTLDQSAMPAIDVQSTPMLPSAPSPAQEQIAMPPNIPPSPDAGGEIIIA